MRKGLPSDRARRRGAAVLIFFGLSVLLAIVAAGVLLGSNSSAGISAPASRVADPLAAAREAYADRDLARAEENLRRLLQSDPKDADARLLLAQVLLGRGRLRESKGIFESLLQDRPNHLPAARGVAEAAEAAGEIELAISAWRRAAALSKGKDGEPLVRVARLLLKRGDTQGALAALQQARSAEAGREDVESLFQEVLAAQAAPMNPPTPPHLGGPSMPSRPPLPPDPRTSIPIPKPLEPHKGYPTGGNPR